MGLRFWGILKGLLVQEETDRTKEVVVQVNSSATTGTRTTLDAAQTDDRTLTLPDATDTLVGKATTDTMTNKTLGDTNTINAQDDAFTIDDASDATLQLDFNVAGTTGTKTTITTSQTTNKIITLPDTVGTVTVATEATTDNAIPKYNGTTGAVQDSGVIIDDSDNVTGINDMTVGGDLTVSGTTTTIDTTNLNVTDKNITINDGGNDAASEGAGLTVERTGTDGSIIYKDASPTKFAIGAVGSEIDVLDASTADTVTNKTMTAAGNTFSGFTHGSEVDNPTTGVHGVTGTVVGTSDVQVLTLKDYDGGTASDTNRTTLAKDTTSNLAGLSRKQGNIFHDTILNTPVFDNGATMNSFAAKAITTADLLENLGIDASVGSSALTIALKQSDGSTDPSTGTAATQISFRGTTLANGDYNVRSATSAVSLVISSGSTLGHTSAAEEYIYVYAIDNAGTIELAASTSLFDDGTLQTTTAEGGAGAADNAALLYSTTLRSNVPIRLIGRLRSVQSTAGTWDAVPEQIQLRWEKRYTLGSTQEFTGSDTWTRPEGCVAVEVEVWGAGGGGGGADGGAGTAEGAAASGAGGGYSRKFITFSLGATEIITVGTGGTAGAGSTGVTGGTGGTSSFGSHNSAAGGVGGTGDPVPTASTTVTNGPIGGVGSGGDINLRGSSGGSGTAFGTLGATVVGPGGTGANGAGGGTSRTGNATGIVGAAPGGGGSGGSVVANAADRSGGAGGDGLVTVKEYY